jgi:CHASE1-domain containing sensor protein
MQKFSWRTLIIFVMVLLLGVILLGLGTAYVSKLKQQRRQLPNPLDTEHLWKRLLC